MKNTITYLLLFLLTNSQNLLAQKVIPHQELGKWGFVDSQTFQKTSRFEYDFVDSIQEDMYVGVKSDSFYIFNNSQIVYQNIFDRKKDFRNNRFHYGSYLNGYSEGLCAIRKNKLWGFIDKQGKWQIPPKYEMISAFEHGYASVGQNYLNKLIHKTGKEVKVKKPKLYVRATFNSGLALFSEQAFNLENMLANYYYVDTNGNIKIDVYKQFGANYAQAFTNDLAIVAKLQENEDVENFEYDLDDGKYGVIDKNGKIIIPLEYKKIHTLGENQVFALTQDAIHIAFFDRKGKQLTDFKYNDFKDLGENRIAVFESRSEKWGIIDFQGKMVVNPMYEDIYPFSQKEAMVKISTNLFTFIDINGKELYEPNKVAFVDVFGDYPEEEFREERFQVLNPIQFKSLSTPSYQNQIGFMIDNTNPLPPQYEDYKRFYEVRDMSNQLIPVQKNGKWGYIDEQGNTKIDFKYDDALHFFSTTYTGVKKNGKWGFIGRNGVEIGKFDYDSIRYDKAEVVSLILNDSEASGFYQVQKNGKWGVANHTGKAFIPCEYDDSFDFRENIRTIAKKNRKYGVIDYKNKVIIPFDYDKIQFKGTIVLSEIDEIEAHYKVQKNGKWGYIKDKQYLGIIKITTEYEKLRAFGKKYILAQKNKKYGILNTDGEKILDFAYDNINTSVWRGYKTWIEIDKGGKKGILNLKTQKILIPCEFDKIVADYDGFAEVQKNRKWGTFSIQKNKTVVPCEYDTLLYSYPHWNIVRKNGKYGLVNETGKLIIKCKYDSLVNQYNEGEMHVLAMQKNKWGAFDDKGNMMVSLKYDELGRLFLAKDRPIGIQKNGKWGYINIKGKLIIPYKYQDATCFLKVEMQDGNIDFFALVRENGKWGLINEQGQFIFKPRYEWIYIPKEGKYDTRNEANLNGKTIYFDYLGNEYEEEN